MNIHFEPNEEKNFLEKYTVNLTQKAKEGKLDPVIGRDEQIRRVIQILSRRTKNNPVLLGDPGVGKTAIVEGLAQRIVAGDVPENIKNREILAFDLAAILAGSAFRGEFEKRLKKLLQEIEKNEDKYILFIDELHTLVRAGAAEGAVDAGNMLKPALAKGTLRAIGATTVHEYRLYIEKDAALERRFQPVYLDEPTIEDTVAILRGIKEKYELHHGIKISDDALISAATLSVRYLPDRFLPDKAIDLIDEAASAAKIEIDSMPFKLDRIKRKITQAEIELAALKKEKGLEDRKEKLKKEIKVWQDELDKLNYKWQEEKKIIKLLSRYRIDLDKAKAQLEKAEREVMLEKAAELKYGKIPELEKKIRLLEQQWQKIPAEERLLREQVSSDDIAQVVSKWTGIPLTRLLMSESEKYARLETELKKRVAGQDHALEKLARAIKRSRVGLGDINRPIGSFLFLGPTGVGKTETAKALSSILFNDEKAVIRFDLTEYQEAHSIARLIGAPPGYVGFEEGGQLTEAVRRRPYSVVLFDELEKAHPQIFNIFLQILDEGRLTDGRGRTVNFKNTVIIFTSNLGSEIFVENKSFESQEKDVLELIQRFFKPEFINRLDSIIVYHPISKEIMRKIVDFEIEKLKERLKVQNLNLVIDSNAKEYLSTAGFSQEFGARPLKRIINEKIVDEIALLLLEKKIGLPTDVAVKEKNGRLLINIIDKKLS